MTKRFLGMGLVCLLSGTAFATKDDESLVEYKGTVKGTLVGRIEAYQSDGGLHVAYAENRAGAQAVMSRGGKTWTLSGKWRVCEHGEKASYCQLEGSQNVYKFGSSMAVDDRGQPTTVLAATNSGYAARVTTASGDTFIHRAGSTEKVLAKAKVTQAWSTGDSVAYMPNVTTLRSYSLASHEVNDLKVKGQPLVNVEHGNSSSSSGDDYECTQTGSHCGDGGFAHCYVTEYVCRCKPGAQSCSHGAWYTSSSMWCPDTRADEPACGDPGCGAAAMAFSDDILSVAGMCAGSITFSFECASNPPGGNPGDCFSLPPATLPNEGPPDIQVTTSPVSFAGTSLQTGVSVTVQRQPSGDIYLEAR